MAEFIALQKFTPKEHQSERRCIWCNQKVLHNKAHIISKKLTITSHRSITLRYSICPDCNSKCGQIENWILRNSPLGWIRFFFYLSSNRASDTSSFPSYFYAEDLHKWLVYRLEGSKLNKTIDTQLILTREGQLTLIAEHAPDDQLEIIRTNIKRGTYIPKISPALPEDFSSRALIDQDKTLVLAHSQKEIDFFINTVCNTDPQEQSRHLVKPKSSERDRQHFKWSTENWIKFSAKIAYETLCLFEGPRRCLHPEFERVRSFVLAGVSKHYREIVFNEHGPLGQQDIPNIFKCVDLTYRQECPRDLPVFAPRVDPGMHSVVLYEIDGWICASVSISGFPPTSLVLGGPDAHLSDLYLLIYDDTMDEFDTVCLAYDPSQLVIPLPLKGHMIEAVARTYKLRYLIK